MNSQKIFLHHSRFIYFGLLVALFIRNVDARNKTDTSQVEETIKPPADQESLKIVGGDDAEKGKLYWQVSIQEKKSHFHFCGGSIVDEYWILTAAHCLIDVHASDIKVVAGEYDLDIDEGDEVSVNAKTLFIHEDYDKTGLSENDIGLIHLESKLSLTSTINTIDISEEGDGYTGIKCTVSGWGTRNSGDDEGYHILQEVEVPVVSDEVCQYGCWMEEVFCTIVETQLCAGYQEGGKDACQGDSGGPLACFIEYSPILAGVVSTGYECGKPNLYGIYTEVSYFKDWIESTIENSAFSAFHANHFNFMFFLTGVAMIVNYLKYN